MVSLLFRTLSLLLLVVTLLPVVAIFIGQFAMLLIERETQHCSIDPMIQLPWIIFDAVAGDSTVDEESHQSNITVTSIRTCDVFSDSYDTARHKFRTAVEALPSNTYQLVSLPIRHTTTSSSRSSSSSNNRNNNNETEVIQDSIETEYTIDIAVIHGRTCPTNDDDDGTAAAAAAASSDGGGIVVHVSGTHGIEGFAGSAIQIAFLHAYAKQQERFLQGDQLPVGTTTGSSTGNRNTRPCRTTGTGTTATVILVHAFNPYGMKQYRRVNEHNVDLNRNGLVTDADWEQVLQGNHYNTIPYDTLVTQQLLSHSSLSSSSANKYNTTTSATTTTDIWLERYIYSWLRLSWAVVRYGIPTLKAALVGGQYHVPDGLFYGGGGGSSGGGRNHTTTTTTTTTTIQQEQHVNDQHDHPASHHTSQRNEPSLIIVREWLDTFLTQRRLRRQSRHPHETEMVRTQLLENEQECVTWIDVHTGLGPTGVDTLLFGAEMDSPDPKDINEWFPNSLAPKKNSKNTNASSHDNSSSTVTQTTTDESANNVRQGYERVVGFTMDYYYTTVFKKQQYDDNRHNLFMVQEFGTVPSILSGQALIVEHLIYDSYARRHKSHTTTTTAAPEAAAMQKFSKEILGAAFYPQRTIWRINVLQRGIDALQKAIRRSSHYSSRDVAFKMDDSVHTSDSTVDGEDIQYVHDTFKAEL